MSKAKSTHESSELDTEIDFAANLAEWQTDIEAYKPTQSALEALTKIEETLTPAIAVLSAASIDTSDLNLSEILSKLAVKKATIVAENTELKSKHDSAKARLESNRQDSDVYEGLSNEMQTHLFKKVWSCVSVSSYSCEVSKALREVDVHGLNSALSLRSSIRVKHDMSGKPEKVVRFDVQAKRLVISVYSLAGIVQRFVVEADGKIYHEILAVARGKSTSITSIHKASKVLEEAVQAICKLV